MLIYNDGNRHYRLRANPLTGIYMVEEIEAPTGGGLYTNIGDQYHLDQVGSMPNPPSAECLRDMRADLELLS